MAFNLSRRAFVASSTAAIAISLRGGNAFGASRDVYGTSIVIDGLGSPGNSTGSDTGAPLADALVKDVRDSGITCVHVTVQPVGTIAPDTAFTQAVLGIGQWEREIDRHPDTFMRVRTAADILAAKKASRTGLVYGFQDGVAFETDLTRLDELHRLGLRVVQPTYNRRNLLGDGCLEPANAGLSRAGIEAVERMNTLGILVDLSHCGRQTAADAIKASKRPVAFTHTGSAALCSPPTSTRHAASRPWPACSRRANTATPASKRSWVVTCCGCSPTPGNEPGLFIFPLRGR